MMLLLLLLNKKRDKERRHCFVENHFKDAGVKMRF
jgi:hypothetical protein